MSHLQSSRTRHTCTRPEPLQDEVPQHLGGAENAVRQCGGYRAPADRPGARGWTVPKVPVRKRPVGSPQPVIQLPVASPVPIVERKPERGEPEPGHERGVAVIDFYL